MRPPNGAGRGSNERLRQAAAAWFARLRGPDAERHRAGFEAWRKADPRHEATYQRLVRRWDEAAILSERPARPPARGRLWPAWGIPALGAAVLAMATLILISPRGAAWIGDWSTMPGSPYRRDTEVGEIRTLRLPDGSALTLDTDTVVATRFSRSLRLVRLARGRVRVGATPDPARPFVVATEAGSIRAQGALFDIWRRSDHQIAVTPLRGAVDVTANPPAGEAPFVIRVRSGQALAFGRGLAAPRLGPVAPNETLWPSGRLDFDETPLAEALAEANRYSRRQIILADPGLGALRVSGVFPAAAAQALARSLATAFDLQVATNPQGDYVLSRIPGHPQGHDSPPP